MGLLECSLEQFTMLAPHSQQQQEMLNPHKPLVNKE